MQLAKVDIEKRVETATKNDEEIFRTVLDWLNDTSKIVVEVEMLKKEIEVNQLKTCFNGWCPNWGARHQLGRKATKTCIRLKEIINRGRFEGVGSRALLSETNFEENIGVPLSKGCKMLLTTRNKKVYGHKEYQSLIPLNVLKEHEGVALLKRQAGIDDDCDDLDSLASQIARECDGLPLALVTTGSKLKELSVRLICPKLKILLLGGEKQWLYNYDKSKLLKVSDECFEEMKALEVVSLRYADLSLKSLQFLTNLKTLELSDCNLRDISFLAKLNKLEILSFRGSRFDELPIELSELKELRMLDLRGCYELKRIPSNLIRSFSQLEELYIEKDIFEEWEVQEKSIETGKARLSEVNDLPCLAVLYLKIHSKCLPKDFAFSKLSRYQIRVNVSIHESSESSKALKIADIDATLLTALFKALYHSVEYLSLERVTAGLIQLKNLEIEDAAELKQVFHGKEEDEVAEEGKDIKLPNLEELKLFRLEKLTRFFPENNHSTLPALEEFSVIECPNLTIKEGVLDEFQNLQVIKMTRGFQQLETLQVIDNSELEQIIDVKDGEEVGANLLQTLSSIEVEKCHKLKNLFPISIARGFQQLERLQVIDNSELEQIIDVKDGEEVGANLLKTLSSIEVEKCHKLKNLFPISIARGFQQLERLQVIDNSELEQIIDVKDGEEVGANLLQTLSNIRVEKCHKLKNLFPISIARGFQQLEWLKVIDNSELKEIFGDNDVINEKEIQLPRLEVMQLEDLPRLTNFCHVGYHFIFPIPPFEWLVVRRCPKISTRFSWDEENKSVHAEAKAPKIGNAEDESHEETSTDLICGRAGFKNLPQYIEVEKVYSNSHPTE
ncbi:hypothetical protein Pint_36473 [Pistacia integerrima]|uniref:Uncharacterized protein n=1 Tax=Pistacia integerrima TaxID=434235 RepID=A0ACC0Y3I2_9ROSI|nr:hypothetical protein Pint_36473 [Pistacia integerrima]